MEHRLILYKNSRISYYQFGSGSKTAICFHGFGEDGTLYSFLEKYAGDQYTFYSIDLPFHGKTEWNEGMTLTHKDLQQIIAEILRLNNQKQKTLNLKLSLLGFSLGGRIREVLNTAQLENMSKDLRLF